jgi:hypothetical protein
VNDAAAVRGVERVGELDGDVEREALAERATRKIPGWAVASRSSFSPPSNFGLVDDTHPPSAKLAENPVM